jgi:hypothetical protein
MFFDRLRYELQLMGIWVILAPVLTMVTFTLWVGIVRLRGMNSALLFSAGLEMLLPLLASVVAATLLSQDSSIEVQLTLPHRYELTVLRRLALIIIWTACIGLISTTLIAFLHLSFLPAQIRSWATLPQFLASQLTWLAPLLWFTIVGLLLTLLARSRAASNTLLCGIWLAEILAHGIFASTAWLQPWYLFPATLTPKVPFWLVNRFEVISIALLFLIIVWLLLRQPERLLKVAGEE